MIEIKDLIKGRTYEGEGRNFNTAVWNGYVFIGTRFKFGGSFQDYEEHIDASDKFGTFIPITLTGS